MAEKDDLEAFAAKNDADEDFRRRFGVDSDLSSDDEVGEALGDALLPLHFNFEPAPELLSKLIDEGNETDIVAVNEPDVTAESELVVIGAEVGVVGGNDSGSLREQSPKAVSRNESEDPDSNGHEAFEKDVEAVKDSVLKEYIIFNREKDTTTITSPVIVGTLTCTDDIPPLFRGGYMNSHQISAGIPNCSPNNIYGGREDSYTASCSNDPTLPVKMIRTCSNNNEVDHTGNEKVDETPKTHRPWTLTNVNGKLYLSRKRLLQSSTERPNSGGSETKTSVSPSAKPSSPQIPQLGRSKRAKFAKLTLPPTIKKIGATAHGNDDGGQSKAPQNDATVANTQPFESPSTSSGPSTSSQLPHPRQFMDHSTSQYRSSSSNEQPVATHSCDQCDEKFGVAPSLEFHKIWKHKLDLRRRSRSKTKFKKK